jgi:hypothetical protein
VRQGGRPVRGFFAGLLLGICLSLDLALTGAVKLDSAVLTILPVALAVVGVLLGWWSPIGRKTKPVAAGAAPLPTPVPWPDEAPAEGSVQHAPPGDTPPESPPSI